MDNPAIHLARKWRSRSFNTIKGQDLVVRILQNNLYRGYFFPLYLFAGPRGSGKTSTARIFAAAVNCRKLSDFRDAPREVDVPCHACDSCSSLFAGSHPDVVEVDAASYTGVDNVRSIIDSATLLPVMGHKKVYIIDEAHMLSKAACNAFLKILEEPPSSAIFILATTDPSKILTTVTSRSLQLYFDRVSLSVLQEHIQYVCDAEEIPYDETGVQRLVQAADGSVRDALQLLERVYLASESITRHAVIEALGEIDEQTIIDIFAKLAHSDVATSMQYIHELQIEQYAPLRIWYRVVAGLRALFWGHFGVVDSIWESTRGFYDVVHAYPTPTLQRLLEIVYTYEAYIVKTIQTQPLFEMLFFEFKRIIDGAPHTSSPQSGAASVASEEEKHEKEHAVHATDAQTQSQKSSEYAQDDDNWSYVVRYFEEEGDPLVASVFKQAQEVVWDDSSTLRITFARELQFYHDWMKDHMKLLQQLVERVYHVKPEITFAFTNVSLTPREGSASSQTSGTDAQAQNASHAERASSRDTGSRNSEKKTTRTQRTQKARYEQISDIQDADKWPFAHVVLQAFPGSIKRMKRE